MLEHISEILIQLIDQVGVIGIFIATFVESIFPPIPSEIVLLSAGFYAQTLNSPAMIIVFSVIGALGNYFGTLPFYYIAKKSSDGLLLRFIDKFGPFLLISRNDLDKAQRYFDKRGKTTIFVARLIPGIRSLIAFPAGISKVDFKIYTIYSLLGSILWNLVLTTLGYFAYDKRDQIFAILKPVENIIILGIVLLVGVYVAKVVVEFVKLKRENNKQQ